MSRSGFIDPSLYSLLPQEEKLEVKNRQGSLFIGIPKETCLEEKRIGLSPDAVALLVAEGHEVRLESGAGEGARFTDNDYSEAGAQIEYSKERVYEANILLKVEPPSDEEIALMKPKQTIISALQLKMRTKSYFEELSKKRITALSYEGIQDEDGVIPIVRSMSEIAGSTAVLIAAQFLSNLNEGSGQLLGGVSGVPPTSVVILGAGTVGTFAARTALALGSQVSVFDVSIARLRRLQDHLNAPIQTCIVQPNHLSTALERCDVAIGAVRSESGRTPCLVSEAMVEQMKEGAVIVDVSIDQGGAFETSELTDHSNPIFKKYGVVHYCVPNIPSRVSRTASASLSNVLGPLLLDIGAHGGLDEVLHLKKGVRSGLYMYNGVLTSRVLGEHYGLSYSEAELFFRT
jgi:alanine dehydrogenase